MAKRKRWAIATGFLLCCIGSSKIVVNEAVASPPENVSNQKIKDNIINKNISKNVDKNIESYKIEHLVEQTTKIKDVKFNQDNELDQFIEDAVDNRFASLPREKIIFSAKTDLLLTKEGVLNNKSINLESHSSSKKNITMKKLANYISDNYDVPLEKAETIVHFTYIEASKKNLDPALVLSIMGIESTFKQYSKSSSGAVGLTQVMPHVHRKRISEHKVNIWSVQGNIKIGTDILTEYIILAGGNLKKALQMYNGSTRDKKYAYSNKVMSKMNKFRIAAR